MPELHMTVTVNQSEWRTVAESLARVLEARSAHSLLCQKTRYPRSATRCTCGLDEVLAKAREAGLL